jgi:hypothetical protein
LEDRNNINVFTNDKKDKSEKTTEEIVDEIISKLQ